MIYRYGRYSINTESKHTQEFDAGSTGRIGHYSTQGNRYGYCTLHRDGSVTAVEVGSGYAPCKSGGYDWEDNHAYVTHYASINEAPLVIQKVLVPPELLPLTQSVSYADLYSFDDVQAYDKVQP